MLTHNRLTRIPLAIFFSLPAPLVTLFLCFGPGSICTKNVCQFEILNVFFVLALIAASTLVWLTLFKRPKFRDFSFFVFLWTLFCATLVSVLAFTIHRDYFTAVFQYLLILPAVFLYRMFIDSDSGISRPSLRFFARTGYVLAAFYVQWIMLMGYAIASRTEPRPFESIIYNVYNLILVFILVALARAVEGRFFHQIVVQKESIIIDGQDITPIFGSKGLKLLNSFLASNEKTLRCFDIQFSELTQDSLSDNCRACILNENKATLCKQYKTNYNSILELKKILETFQVGTIIAPDNKRSILTEGWHLVFFDSTRVKTR